MIRLRPRNVRMRLTLWYVSVLAAILVLYAAGSSTFLWLNLRRELDRNLIQDIETVESLLSVGPDGNLRLLAQAEENELDEAQKRLLEIRSLDGALLYRADRLRNQNLGGVRAPHEGENGYSERSSRLPDGTRIRLVSRLHTVGKRPVLIRLGRSEEPLWHEFKDLLWVLLLGLPAAIAIAGFGGYALAGRALAPIDTMTRRAEHITAERLNERLPVENSEDELGHLATVFNKTLARLEQSFEQLRRFTADASHELRTPLTAIRSVGEVGLQKDGSAAQYRDIIGSMLEEANHLTRLVDSLLTISRADAGHIQLNRVQTGLMDLAQESAALLEVLAEEKGQQISVQGDQSVAVYADRVILRQALVNLIDNAVKYSPPAGKISVYVKRLDSKEAMVEVEDSGPGIAPEHQSKIFDRFYRSDKARSREAGGAGLGLSIAKWAVESHGGLIELQCGDSSGCTFRVRLPLETQVHDPRPLNTEKAYL
jgi:heavy metal sensor kinase